MTKSILIALSALPLFAGEYDSEIKKHQEIVSKDPTNLDAAFKLGNYLAWDARYEEAVKVFDQILAKEPKYKEAKIAIARTYSWAGNQELAAEEFKNVLKEDQNCYEAHQGLGLLSLWANNFTESIEHFKTALRINPNDAVSHKGIGRAYLAMGDRRRAEEHFVRAQILEVSRLPMAVTIAIAAGAFLAAGSGIYLVRRVRRTRKYQVLLFELELLRKTLELYHERAGKFPLAIEHLLHEKRRLTGIDHEEKPYLVWRGRLDNKGMLADPFNKRYWYNSETGKVSSATAPYENI